MIRIACLSLVRSLVLPLLLCLAACTAASAAKVRLLAYQRVGEDMEVNIVDSEGKPLSKEAVKLPTGQLSPPTDIAAKAMVFISPKDPAKILGKVVLPATGEEFALIFLPAGQSAAQPYKIDAVALPGNEFRAGDYAYINYSGTAVGFVIDGERLAVPHGKFGIYQGLKSGNKPGNRPLLGFEQKDGAWEARPFYSSRIVIQDGVRNLVFICRNPQTGDIDFRGIADFVVR